MESVLEISTDAAARTRPRPATQLRALRRQVRRDGRGQRASRSARPARIRSRCGRTSGSSRARATATSSRALRFVARQELIFGMHVHVGVDDPDKAIHVANGMRVHVPVLLALSANSPFWRADATGLHSTRTPIFRAFPRVGIPPDYRDWADYERQIDFMVEQRRDRGLHVPLVRRAPAPELRHRRGPRDGRARRGSSTRSALAALIQAMVKELCEHFDAGQAASATTRARCSTRTSGSPRATGSTASSSTCPARERVATATLAQRLLDRLRDARRGPRLRRRARGHRRPARARQRRRAPARGLRGQPRPARGHGARSSRRRRA